MSTPRSVDRAQSKECKNGVLTKPFFPVKKTSYDAISKNGVSQHVDAAVLKALDSPFYYKQHKTPAKETLVEKQKG